MAEAKAGARTGRQAKIKPVLKVLVIDPNPNNRDRVKAMVRDCEFVETVTDRASPHSILDVLAQNPAHVIMIDQDPGAGNVFDIVRVIRTKEVGANTGFVLMGEELGDEVRARGKSAGVAAFLSRPHDQKAVEEALKEALKKVMPQAAVKPDGGATKISDALRDTLDKLRKVSLFAEFTDPELVRLLKICRTRQFNADTYVFHEGEPGTSLYVLVAGELHIRTKVDGEDRTLVEMTPGDCFGEMAIISAEPRSADAVAATDCTVIEVDESVVNNNDDILSLKLVRQIAILLAKKLRMASSANLR